MRRSDICLYLGPADRAELHALLSNRNTPRKLAWRAGIVLVKGDGVEMVEIIRRTGLPKPTLVSNIGNLMSTRGELRVCLRCWGYT